MDLKQAVILIGFTIVKFYEKDEFNGKFIRFSMLEISATKIYFLKMNFNLDWERISVAKQKFVLKICILVAAMSNLWPGQKSSDQNSILLR